jgi:sugar phosphate permease
VSAYILTMGWDYKWCMIVPAVVNGVWAFITYSQVPNTPEEIG